MSVKKIIMLVDDSITNLSVGKSVLGEKYSVLTVPSGEKALALLEKVKPNLILLDVNMPDMDGYETIRRIKQDPSSAHIPVIFLTAKNDDQSELMGLSTGAVDYITKPFSQTLLIKRIEVHLLIEEQRRKLWEYNKNLYKMVDEKAQKVLQLQDSILSTIADLIEFRDGLTGGHDERSSLYLGVLLKKAREKNLYIDEIGDWDINLLVRSAQLHDVGKICISDSILRKPHKLTDNEYTDMKRHTVFGRDAIEKISQKTGESEFLQHAAIMAFSHHERWDGKGYPLGLKGEQIPLQGRFMAIADVYDALVSQRGYKQPFAYEEAKNTIIAGAGTQFDPALVQVFHEVAHEFESIAKGGTL